MIWEKCCLHPVVVCSLIPLDLDGSYLNDSLRLKLSKEQTLLSLGHLLSCKRHFYVSLPLIKIQVVLIGLFAKC